MIAVVIDVWQTTAVDELVIGSAAFLSAGAVIWRKAIRPAVAAFHKGARAWEWIEMELQPNGGESLRDKVDGITKALADAAPIIALIPELLDRIERLEQQDPNRKEHVP